MILLDTRKLTVKDLPRISNLYMLNDNVEEDVFNYLRISLDGNYLVYCKIIYHSTSTTVTTWVYKFSSKTYFRNSIFSAGERVYEQTTDYYDYVRIYDPKKCEDDYIGLIVI